jgi:hypothetical protein
MGHPDPRVKEPIVVVDFSYRPHGGPGVTVGSFLFYRNSRGKPLNIIQVRLVHTPQKLPGIGGKAFHITPLTFGKDGVKGQGTFTGPGQAGDND